MGRLNRKIRRDVQHGRAKITRSKFGEWVDAAPDKAVTRSEFEAALAAGIETAIRNYHDRYSPIRVLARGFGYTVGVLLWPFLRLRAWWRVRRLKGGE